MAVFYWIAIAWGTERLTISLCVAPLLLLRTPESVQRGVSVVDALERFGARLEDLEGKLRGTGVWRLLGRWAFYPAVFLLIVVLPVLIRTGATLAILVRHPLRTLSSIPRNWWRIVACIDSIAQPEPIPGLDDHLRQTTTIDKHVGWLWASTAFRGIARPSRFAKRARWLLPPLWIMAVFVFVPPRIYRLALKGSAAAYLPFVWLAREVSRNSPSERLEEIRHSVRSYIRLTLSALVIVLVASKLTLSAIWATVDEWLESTDGGEVLATYIAPLEVPLWQISSFVNSLIAWALFVYADGALRRQRRSGLAPSSACDTVLRSSAVVQGVLSLYSIMLVVYVTASLAESWALPSIGSELLPEGCWEWLKRRLP